MNSKPPVPIAVYKERNGDTSDLCIPIMNLQAGQLVWNTRLAHVEPAFIQRFIFNGSPCAFILRVTFQPTLGNYLYQIYQNTIPVAQDRHQFSKTLKFASQDSRATIRRGWNMVIQVEADLENCTPADRFCVTTSLPESFQVSPLPAIESVKAQVSTIKFVLEKGYLSDFNLELLELVTDFAQDKDGKWFFISLHSYKTELVVKKKITTESLGKLLERLVTPPILPKLVRPSTAVTTKKLRKRRRLRKRPSFSTWDAGLMTDDTTLRQSMVEEILRDIKLHPVKIRRRKVDV